MLSVLDLSHHDSREKLDRVLHKLKWNDFPGLQALLLKVTKTVNDAIPACYFLSLCKANTSLGRPLY